MYSSGEEYAWPSADATPSQLLQASIHPRNARSVFNACIPPAHSDVVQSRGTTNTYRILVNFLGLGKLLSGLLAYGIGNIHNGALETWRYQFVIVGAFSSAWGLIMYFLLAESPVTS
jgi:hypothetical protein